MMMHDMMLMTLMSQRRIAQSRVQVMTTTSHLRRLATLSLCLHASAWAPTARRIPLHIRGRKRVAARWLCASAQEPAAAPRRVIFLGTPDVAAQSLTLLMDAAAAGRGGSFEVVGVVTQPPARSGRGQQLVPSPVQALAEERGIEVLAPVSAKDEGFLAALEAIEPDMCITAAYGNFLPKAFLSIPRFGTLNVHPSLLPRWRGASPVQRAVEAGDAEMGVSVVETVLKMDAGPILATRTIETAGDERADDLLQSLFVLGTEALIEVLPAVWDGAAARTDQDEANAVAAAKISKDEAILDLSATSASDASDASDAIALRAHNKCRAFVGWPGTSLEIEVIDDDEGASKDPITMRLKVVSTVFTPPSDEKCAAIVASLGEREVLLVDGMLATVCSDGSLLQITQVQPPNKKPMSARAFWNGLRGATLRWRLPA